MEAKDGSVQVVLDTELIFLNRECLLDYERARTCCVVLFGGDWFNEEAYRTGRIEEVTIDSPANLEAYRYFVDLLHRDRIAIDNYGTGDWKNRFYNGTVGMVMGEGPWLVMGNTSNIDFRFGMAPNPWGTTQASMIYTDPWMVSSQTENPDAAWEFIKYMTSKSVLRSYLSFAIFPPARRSVMEDYLFSFSRSSGHHSPEEIMQALNGAQKYGRETPEHVLVGFPQFQAAIADKFPQFWSGERSVMQVLGEVQGQAEGILKELYKQK